MRVFEDHVLCASPQRVAQNMHAVMQYAASQGAGMSSFWPAIRLLQSNEISLDAPMSAPHFIWSDYQEHGLTPALTDLMAGHPVTKACEYSIAERARHEETVRHGLERFGLLFPSTYSVFTVVVAYIVMAKLPTYGGGSVSNRIGLIWLAPGHHMQASDYAASTYHEFIHQCLFLEDMVNGIFPYSPREMVKPANRVRSAIRRVERGYDKSYHSAFVASGLVEYHTRSADYDRARSLLPDLFLCLDALTRKTYLLTSNGIEHLRNLINCVLEQADALDYAVSSHAT